MHPFYGDWVSVLLEWGSGIIPSWDRHLDNVCFFMQFFRKGEDYIIIRFSDEEWFKDGRNGGKG